MLKTFISAENTELKDYYLQRESAVTVKDKLKIDTVPNGYVCIDIETQSCGVFDADKNFVDTSKYCLNGKQRRIPNAAKIRKDIPYLDIDVIYCDGGRMFHFGHTLLEGIARIYPYLDKKYKNCKFVFCDWGRNPIKSYGYKLLELFGIKQDQIIILKKTTRFRNVVVPEADFEIPSTASVEFIKTFEKIAKSVPKCDTYDKIYLSRTATGERKTFGEEQIEYIFEQNGYKIIHPEQLPLEQQIGIMRDCRQLAGLAGTALHLSAFMPSGGTVIQLKRQTQIADNLDTQHAINCARGLDTILICASVEPVPTPHFSAYPQLVGLTPELQKFCDEMNFKFDTQHIKKLANTAVNEYNMAMKRSRKIQMHNRIKKTIAKIISCPIPGRHRRREVRKIMHRTLRVYEL